ncbi:hypothetical protein B9479_007846 [Cryptococcus floricola]|uniref:Uncharacterized protein n=1 Tax=Cryptococcus floricola TaxID=2591691 RepID=A0A5D3API2_9TREE|nr:hypothetical protein B9479_007846 [Cryptococcus floricola]
MSFEKPRLHLDFNSPSYPPLTYSPNASSATSPPTTPPSTAPFSGFASKQYASPFSPTRRSMATSPPSPTSPTMSEMSEKSMRTPPRIVMGAMVSTSPKSDYEEECSLEVPGIVLTEPSHVDPRPRPPPKQTVLLAPTSLPLPPPGSSPYGHSSQSSISSKSKHQFSPAFLSFLHGGAPSSSSVLYAPGPGMGQSGSVSGSQRKSRMKALVLMGVVVLGGWHLWSSMMEGDFGGLVEEAGELL